MKNLICTRFIESGIANSLESISQIVIIQVYYRPCLVKFIAAILSVYQKILGKKNFGKKNVLVSFKARRILECKNYYKRNWCDSENEFQKFNGCKWFSDKRIQKLHKSCIIYTSLSVSLLHCACKRDHHAYQGVKGGQRLFLRF